MSQEVKGYIMAFDFGLRHIGVALGQTVTHTARGLATVSASSGKPDWREVRKLMDQYAPTKLVVGLPLNMDGTESEMAVRARAFAQELGRRSGLPVCLHDERLSTREARESLADAKALGQASTEHELAACYILTSWFDTT